MNIIQNYKSLAVRYFVVLSIFSFHLTNAEVFISEYSEGSSTNKYLEIYNGTGADLDMAGYGIGICNNDHSSGDNPDPLYEVLTVLEGTCAPGDVFVVSRTSADSVILSQADWTNGGGTGSPASFNGDDWVGLYKINSDGTETLIDVIGNDPSSGNPPDHDVAGITGAGKDHTLVRKPGINSGNVDWAASSGTSAENSEWIVYDQDSWEFLGSHQAEVPSPFAGTWKLSPVAGALKVGPNPNDGGWWTSSIEDTSNRACLFDDKYVLHPDGSFENVLGDQTWIEDWQGYVNADGNPDEGCAAPVAPHDGSNAATWSHNETDNKLTLDGVGAFLGLAKAFTGGELSTTVTEVPASRTYDIYQSDQNSFVVVISTGGGFWTFSMIREGFEPQFVDVTFNLDMSSVDAVSAEGVHVAGGGLFGGPGDNPLLDADGDGIYSGTFTFPANTGSQYTFLNGGSDWNQKEQIAGQSCATPPHNDRSVEWGTDDIVINACFQLCGDGFCSDLQPPATVDITFNLDMSSVDSVSAEGVHVAGGSLFNGPGDNPLLDADGDGIYSGTFTRNANSSSQYTFLNGGSDWNQKEQIAGQSCATEPHNDRFVEWGTEDIVINACFELCGDGFCSDIVPPATVEVTFNTDASEYNEQLIANGEAPLQVIHATGGFEGWSGYGVQLTDPDGDGIYVGVATMLENTTFEYKYVVGGWGSFESGAELGGPCDWNPDDTNNNYGAFVGNSDITLPNYIFGGGCRLSGDTGPEPGIVFSGTFGGAVIDGQTYTNPATAEDWAGFANEDTLLYPLSFPYGGSVAFEAHTAGADVDVYFRFEYMPHPNVEPSYNTQTVTITGADPAFYEVSVPPQGENTFSSFLLYVVTRDAPVTLKQVEVIQEDTEQYVFSNYTLDVSDAASYNAGTASTLPAVDVEGEGIVITATFDTTSSSAPYVGALAIYWDANFNDTLDVGDLNIFEDRDDYDDDYYDDYDSRDHESDGPNVATLIDNDYDDVNTEEGVFVLVVDELDFMEVQGATFFFAALDADLAVTQTITAKPFSSSPIRFKGVATEMSEQALSVPGVFVEIGMDVGYYYNDYYYYDTETLTEGITGLDGNYDIGVSPDTIAAGDVVRLYPYHSDEDNGGRLVPLMHVVDDSTGDASTANEVSFTITDATEYNSDISVLKLNTLVQGFAYGFDGQPLSGYIWVDSQIGSDDNPIELFNSSEVGDNGYYSFWAQNGTELHVTASFDGGPFVEETFFLQAETFDEGLGAFVYNYNIDATPEQTGFVDGYVLSEEMDEYGNYYTLPLAGVEVQIYNNNDLYIVYTDENGNYTAEVNAPAHYFISATNNVDGYTNYGNYSEVFVALDSYSYVDDILFYPLGTFYTISGYVYDQNDQPVFDADVDFSGIQGNQWYDYAITDTSGYYSISVPEGMYDIYVFAFDHYTHIVRGVEIFQDMTMNFTINQVGTFTGSVQGVVTFTGEFEPDGPAHIDVFSESYSASTFANDDGFYSIDLIDGVYGIQVHAPGYDSYIRQNAFEINGNTVTYNVEIYENGYAGPPHMVDLHDVANDQGRQMRAVWHTGIPGSWNYFTQFSIWRKVNNAPVDLWDYIETVPWHGMDPYAAVVPTLGDSSAHGIHMSTFMVTAHTEDVSVWIDSEPMSGYSIDNLHPSAPMSLAFSTSPGSVSLNWSGPVDQDFSYFNIYRQDILTNESAMVFTTTDSFYVDQQLEDVGAYEYWVTAVDISGLESDPSSIVSAVLSADEKMGMPTEFALKQNYPNPFNPSTQIQYALPNEARVLISIYDLTGRKVRTLVNEVQSAGHRSVMWNATNESGRPVSAGMYIYSIQAGDFIQNRKMVLMK